MSLLREHTQVFLYKMQKFGLIVLRQYKLTEIYKPTEYRISFGTPSRNWMFMQSFTTGAEGKFQCFRVWWYTSVILSDIRVLGPPCMQATVSQPQQPA